MADGCLLLVEDDEDTIELTAGAFRKSNLRNEIVVAREAMRRRGVSWALVNQPARVLA